MNRYVRFLPNEARATPAFGVLEEERVYPLKATPFDKPGTEPERTEKFFRLDEVQLLAPVVPGKVVGIGLNYRDHAIEQGKPLPELPYVFLKATSALIGPGDTIRLNRHCELVHYEAELAVVIGKPCKNVSESAALDYVLGFTIANDVTERLIQKQELSFARAKGMDTFLPLGPWITATTQWADKSIRLWINGELRQSGNTNDMIHSVPKLVHFVSEFMTLMPGDVILTGTPAGVGPIKPGDKIKIEIDELGTLENAVEHQA